MNLKELIINFWNYQIKNNIELYNEFSFQHELGIYLRNMLPNYNIQFERNINYFYKDVKDTKKKEIDIVIFKDDLSEKYAIELKYPRNGQHPEQMFSFIKDIKFMEQVKELGFDKTFTMTLVDDKLFYHGNDVSGIYSFFRSGNVINGTITKPTGKKDDVIVIKGHYKINWQVLNFDRRYYLIEI